MKLTDEHHRSNEYLYLSQHFQLRFCLPRKLFFIKCLASSPMVQQKLEPLSTGFSAVFFAKWFIPLVFHGHPLHAMESAFSPGRSFPAKRSRAPKRTSSYRGLVCTSFLLPLLRFASLLFYFKRSPRACGLFAFAHDWVVRFNHPSPPTVFQAHPLQWKVAILRVHYVCAS